MYMSVLFPTLFHKLASKHYNHLPNSRDDAAFILERINEDNLVQFYNVYMQETQFTRFLALQKCWENVFPDSPLNGSQVDMLCFMLHEYICAQALDKRAKKLKRGYV